MTAPQIFEQQKARRVFQNAYAKYLDNMDEFLRDRSSQQMKGIQGAVDDLVAVRSLLDNVDTRDESCAQLDVEIADLNADLAARDKIAAILGGLQGGSDERAQTTALATSLSTTTAELKVIKEDLSARRDTLTDFSRRLAKVDIDGAVDELGALLAAVTRCRDGTADTNHE